MNPIVINVEKIINVYRRNLKRSRYLHSLCYLGARKLLLPLIERFTNFYTVEDDPIWLRLEYCMRSYEKETTTLLNHLVHPGMTVLDIGAHVGYYTRIFSKLVGDTGLVIAFEPHPRTFNILLKNVHALKNVITIQMALSDKEETATLYDFCPESSGSSLRFHKEKSDWYRDILSKEISIRVKKGLPCAKYTVETTRGDCYLAKIDIQQVDFIKMDIEGAEISAIRGMRRIIQSSPSISMIMEYSPTALEKFGVDPSQIINKLNRYEFCKVEIIQGDGRLEEILDKDMLRQLETRLTEGVSRVNFLCTK